MIYIDSTSKSKTSILLNSMYGISAGSSFGEEYWNSVDLGYLTCASRRIETSAHEPTWESFSSWEVNLVKREIGILLEQERDVFVLSAFGMKNEAGFLLLCDSNEIDVSGVFPLIKTVSREYEFDSIADGKDGNIILSIRSGLGVESHETQWGGECAVMFLVNGFFPVETMEEAIFATSLMMIDGEDNIILDYGYTVLELRASDREVFRGVYGDRMPALLQ